MGKDLKYAADAATKELSADDSKLVEILIPYVYKKALKISKKIETYHVHSETNDHLTRYIVGFYDFLLKGNTREEIAESFKNVTYVELISSYIVEHYMNNEELRYEVIEDDLRYDPIATSLNGVLNLLLRGVNSFERDNIRLNAIVDIVRKGLVLSKCVLDLIVGGFEIEAFATWRTLYELSAILTVLVENEGAVIDSYLRHMDYSLAYRKFYYTKEQIDAIFVEIKDQMETLGLKSKDMKRFIEYGWIKDLPDFGKVDPDYRFNFREGIERAAKLEDEHLWFELASELAHSSPLLIYSNKSYFRNITMHNIYATSLRIIDLYQRVYRKYRSPEDVTRFESLMQHYVGELNYFYTQVKNNISKENNPLKPTPTQKRK